MRILYLTHFFPPELNGGALRVDDLSAIWAGAGAEVTVLTGFPSHPTGIVPERYHGHWVVDEQRGTVRVVRSKKYSVPNRGFAKRILNHLSLAVSATVVAVAKRLRPDVVICTSPPLLIGLSGMLLSRVLRAPLVFEVRDLWPDQAIQLGMLRNPVLVWLARKLELMCYSSAVRVVVVTNAARQRLIERGIAPDKVHVFRNGVSVNPATPSTASRPGPLRRGPTDFIVSYFGTMGMSQGLTLLLDTAEELTKRGNSDVRIVLMGDGVERDALVSELGRRKLPNVAILPPCSREEMPAYYADSNAAIICLRDLPLFRDTIPSKVFEIMANERPVLGIIAGETRAIIEEAACGECAEPENATSVADAILRLRAMTPDQRYAMGVSGRRWVAEHCSRDRQAADYLTMLESIPPARSPGSFGPTFAPVV
jgi:colanic acid biosynthesis glycosyl transferase WcaI